MAKSPEMIAALDKISAAWFGRSRTECIEKGICVLCGGEAKSFDDLYARNEFGISGMCQKCQDDSFSE